MKRHPICEELGIPEPTPELVKDIADDMRQYGWDPRFPSWVYQGRILVGNAREAAAKLVGIKPVRRRFRGTEEEAADFVWRSDVARKHLTPEERKQMAEAARALTGTMPTEEV
jgi:hypothetical protein